MGVAVGDYDNSGRFSLFVTNFSEEYNALYHNDGDHFTDVSFRSRDRAGEPAVRRLGHRVPRLRQRRPGSTSSPSTATSTRSSTGARCGASAGYRQRKLLYHNRGDGTFDEVAARYGAGAHGGARQPRPRGRRPRQRRPPRRRDQRSRRQRRRCCTTSWPRAGNWLIVKLQGHARRTPTPSARSSRCERTASPQTRSCRAGRATSRRTTCASISGWAPRRQSTRSTSAGPTARTRRQTAVKADQILRIDE